MDIWALEANETGTQLETLLQQEEEAKAMSATDMNLVAKQQQKKADQVSEAEEETDDQAQTDDDSQASDQTSDDQQSQTESQTQTDDDEEAQVQDGQSKQAQAQVQDPDNEEEDSEQAGDDKEKDEPDEQTKQVTKEHWELVSESLMGDASSFAATTVSTTIGNTQSLTFIGYLGLSSAIKTGAVVLGGVVYGMEKTAKLLFTGIISLKDYVYRRMNSFENLLKQIKDLKASVRSMEITPSNDNDGFEIKRTYTTARVINNLKIEQSVDFGANLQVMNQFLVGLNSEINSAILKDLKMIGYLTELSPEAFSKLKNEGVYSQGFGSLFSKEQLDGYVSEAQNMEFWRSQATLPGDTALFINIPSTSITDKETSAKAFGAANCGIGIDTSSFRDIDEVEYLDKAKLLNLLDRMEKLCLEALSHRQLYEAVIAQKSNMRFKFKVFFADLMSTKDRDFASKKVSAVHFRMQYIDKIYLKMTMDVHDLCVKVLVNSISFAQKNATKL
jgi:hypothetical protein